MTLISHRFISIDPGQNIGLACWESRSVVYTHCFQSNSHTNWLERSNSVHEKLREFLKFKQYYGHIYCEQPKFWQSYLGLSAARHDSFAKLCFSYGRIMQIAHQYAFKFHEVPIADWKGQLPKSLVKQRVENYFSQEFPDHVTDAVGIGLYILGKFK